MNISTVISETRSHLENPNKIQAIRELGIYSKKVPLPWRVCVSETPNNKRNVIISFSNVGWRAEQWSELPKGLGLSWE